MVAGEVYASSLLLRPASRSPLWDSATQVAWGCCAAEGLMDLKTSPVEESDMSADCLGAFNDLPGHALHNVKLCKPLR